jgi:hypothetical protein
LTPGRDAVTLGAAVLLLLGIPLVVAWVLQPATAAGPCVLASGPASLPDIPEASGLAVSRRHPGVLWSHNDSGNAAVLFAVNASGAVAGRVRVPIRARDWEDISAARCGANDCLYIADIGDNGVARPRIQIYRVPEPATEDAQTAPPEVFNAAYVDGPHNAEAMFVVGEDLFIVTRDRTGSVYKASVDKAGDRELTFQRIGQLGLAAVTDAETSRDGTFVVVRTSHEAVLYRTEVLTRGGNTAVLRIPIDGLREPQGEGVALDGNVLYLASEGRGSRGGRLMSLTCDLSRVHD